MHRTKTQFAKRINRVASGLERRGVVATYEVQDRLLANRSSRRRYAQVAPALDDVQRVVLERLREEGYASLPFSVLVPDASVWNELEVNAARFVDETEAGLASEREGGESALRRRAGKEFLVRKYSWGVTLGLDDPWLRLGVNPRLLDHPHVLPRAAVADGRLVGIEFHDGITDPITREGGQHVFDGMDPRVPLCQCRRAVILDHILDARLDFGFSFEVHPTKSDAGIGGGGQKGHRHPISAVQTYARKDGGAIECLLLQHRGIKQAASRLGKRISKDGV